MSEAEPRLYLHLKGQVHGRQLSEVACPVPGLRRQPEHVTSSERGVPPALLPSRPLTQRPQLFPQQLQYNDAAHIGMHREGAAAVGRY
eukprot:6589396-Prymnesium_polylepis.2